MQRAKKISKTKVTDNRMEKRSTKTRLKERQEILDLISSSKSRQQSRAYTQDENQAVVANDTVIYDNLQPYPPLYQDTFDPEVSELLDLIATEACEV